MSDSALTSTLLALEERLLTPAVRGDAEALRELLALDFREIGASGHTYDRTAVIAALASPDPSTYVISDFQLLAWSEPLALVTYRIQVQRGNALGSASLRSSVWRRTGDTWQMIFHQGTPVPALAR